MARDVDDWAKISERILSKFSTMGRKRRPHAVPSFPREARVRSMSFERTPARPSSSGWARSISGQSHSCPYSSSPKERRSRDMIPVGWKAAQFVVDHGIAMDEHVTECHDARQVRYLRCGGRIEAAQPVQGFADDLELPLDRRSEHRVALVVLPRALRDELCDQPSRSPRVPEQPGRFRLHRARARSP